MIADKSVLAIIPARGGSKGVPRKNIRDVAGKPLIAWTIEEARKSSYLDRIVVSTDDREIADISIRYGAEVPFLRPPELAQDDTPGIAPVLHLMRTIRQPYDLVVLLQPTSPLRSFDDIDRAIDLLLEHGATSCASVVEADKSPYWMYSLNSERHLVPILEGSYTCRQQIPAVYALNGAVYVAESAWLLDKQVFVTDGTIAYVMPKDRSIDIDTSIDLCLASHLLLNRSETELR